MLSSVVFWGLIALIGTSRGLYPFTHSTSPHLPPRLYRGCYGDIMTMETLGTTCDINSLINCGIRGSETFAEMDLRAMKPYPTLIKEVGQRHCVDPAVIAAIISRESHGGSVLRDGWDRGGLKFGLMQLDKQIYHPVGTWDSKEHLLQAVGVLTDRIKAIQKKFSTWNVTQHLKDRPYFESGIEAIVTPADVDDDYVNDVLARA
uniref:Lysozyme g-like protein n=1 Tax=Propithecus coquereli TaxID=379532 RepID=A0A2K6GIN1_PROCO